MPVPPESKPVLVSQKIYGRLLLAYPKRHRREYGALMAQLFRDQCRDAWRSARSWGLAGLWFRVLPDLVKTSVLEHLSAMKARKTMVEKISEITNVNTAPLRTFFTWFIIVFLLVFGVSAIITFIMPEAFQSTVRVKVERDSSASANQNDSRAVNNGYDPYFLQTELEVIQSEVVLRKVVEQLDLNAVWGKKYAGGERLKISETITFLRGRMDLRPVRNTSLVAISVYSEDPREAAILANTIAETYRKHRLNQQLDLAKQNIMALREQFDEQELKVHEAQKQVDLLRKELNITDVDAAGNAPAPALEAETVRRLQGELISSKTALAKEETQLSELKRLDPEQRRDAIQTVVGSDAELGTLLSERNLAQQKLLVLAKDYSSDHPEYKKAKALTEETANRISQRTEGIMIGLGARVNSLRAVEEKLKVELEAARDTDIKNAERSRPYYGAKQRLEELTRFRTVVSLKLASEKVDMSLPKSTLVRIIDRAEPGLRPVRPNKYLNLFVGAVVGTLLGAMVGGAVAWRRFRVRPKALGHATAV